MYSHDIIVIGGGTAGLSVASAAAKLGLKTALIDKGNLGGECLHFGCVPSKSLIKTADFYSSIMLSRNMGLPEISTPPINMDNITKRIHKIIKKLEYYSSPEKLRNLGCDVYLTAAKFIDKYTLQLGTKEVISSKRIVIATGSSPKVPDIKGVYEINFLTNRDIFSLKELPKSIITIGAGPVGIELSQALSKLGTKVTIITNSKSILPKEDEDMSRYVENELLDSGVEIIFNAAIKEFSKENQHNIVSYTVNNDVFTKKSKEVLLAVGRTGNTKDLGLDKIGIKTEKSFINVDKYLRTNIKHIMAIGDCNGKNLFTHIAGAEASNAIRKNIFGLKSRMNYSKVPWCTYTKPEIASVGYNEIRALEEGINFDIVEAKIEDIDIAHTEGKTTGKIKVLIDKKERIIGTQIVSDHAGELILPSIMSMGKKLITLLSPIYPYPTLGEIHKKVAGNYYSTKLFNDKNKKILKFMFRYRG